MNKNANSFISSLSESFFFINLFFYRFASFSLFIICYIFAFNNLKSFIFLINFLISIDFCKIRDYRLFSVFWVAKVEITSLIINNKQFIKCE